jgi:hypothetical protein
VYHRMSRLHSFAEVVFQETISRLCNFAAGYSMSNILSAAILPIAISFPRHAKHCLDQAQISALCQHRWDG